MTKTDLIGMLNWDDIDTVLLDLDGVLLDLRFDNWFWREHVPARYAEENGIELDDAKSQLYPKMQAVRGTLDWYSIEYWSSTLQLDIFQLKASNAHRISVRPLVTEFLDACIETASELHLVTNAHQQTLDIKFKQTDLEKYFKKVICSHDYNAPKEEITFWHNVHRHHRFEPERTLFIDDNLEVLRTARKYGIDYLLAIRQPDSGQPDIDVADFGAIRSFAEIMPGTSDNQSKKTDFAE